MELRRLRHAVTLCDRGSYLNAASDLGISPSALSRSIQSLEEELNLQLFDRGRGGVFPTANGALLVNSARKLLRDARQLERSLQAIGSAQIGEVAFGMGPFPGSALLPRLFGNMLKHNPHIAMFVDIDNAHSLLDRLKSGSIEFFICTGSVAPVSGPYVKTILGEMPISLIARSGHPLVNVPRVTLDELNPYPLMGSGFWRWKRDFAPFLEDDSISPHITCDNYEILLSTVLDSDAICIGPSHMWVNSPHRTMLSVLECDSNAIPDSVPITLVTLLGRTLSDSSVRVLAEISEIMSESGDVDRYRA